MLFYWHWNKIMYILLLMDWPYGTGTKLSLQMFSQFAYTLTARIYTISYLIKFDREAVNSHISYNWCDMSASLIVSPNYTHDTRVKYLGVYSKGNLEWLRLPLCSAGCHCLTPTSSASSKAVMNMCRMSLRCTLECQEIRMETLVSLEALLTEFI